LILTEAGGRVSGFSGEAFPLGGAAILASNGRIHQQMLDVIAPGEPS
jgi:fructose-1,6-bisphosphatase/inositol monophosphatase family enzyme